MEPPPYIRVLGFNERGAELLRVMKKTARLPVVSRRADIGPTGAAARRVYALECLAADLCGLCLPVRAACGGEQKYKPLKVENREKLE